MTDWARPKYVSLTTFRKAGTAVATPVWWAPLDDGTFAFTTDPGSWKVRRIKRNPSVGVRPCTMRGQVAADAPAATGTARIVGPGDEYRSVVRALKRKYGLIVTIVEAGGWIKQLLLRNPESDCAVVVTLEG